MNLPTQNQIIEYCREAQEIADREGVQDALSYLIGKKFCKIFSALKDAQNKARFMYADNTDENVKNILADDKSMKMSYNLAVHNNYRPLMELIKSLQEVIKIFIGEINESFEAQDVQDYLNSYPRLGFKKQKQPFSDVLELEDDPAMSIIDVLAEVDDILIVEEIKKLFDGQ